MTIKELILMNLDSNYPKDTRVDFVLLGKDGKKVISMTSIRILKVSGRMEKLMLKYVGLRINPRRNKNE